MIPVLRVKPGVTFGRIAPGGFRILAALDDACLVLKRDLTITSATDSHHAPSRHVTGEAFDVSVLGLETWEIRKLVEVLRQRLSSAFGIWYETSARVDPILAPVTLINPEATAAHIHCQVRRGTSYPPDEGDDDHVTV